MSKNVSTKGISFIPSDNVSAITKLKLEGLKKRKTESINKLVDAYKRGELLPQK